MVKYLFIIIALLAAFAAFRAWQFKSMVNDEVLSFQNNGDTAKVMVTRQRVDAYPAVVRRWLERSGVIGKHAVRKVHLRQQGMMRTATDGAWMPFTAEQWFRTGTPGFIWTADVSAMAVLHIAARDKYDEGRGNMLIKAMSVFPIADARGPEIDQGSMLRYLAELSWFPSAALDSCVQWEEIDATSARATMTYGGITASGVFTFTLQGDVAAFEAKRYYDRKGGATLEDWYIQNDPDGYREFAGVRIPAKSTVTWKLKDGELTWLRLEILEIEYK